MTIDEKIVRLKENINLGFNDVSEFFNNKDESTIVINLIKELTGEQIRINELIDEEMFEQIIYMCDQIDLYLLLMSKWFKSMEFAGDYNFLKEIWVEVQQTNPHPGFVPSR